MEGAHEVGCVCHFVRRGGGVVVDLVGFVVGVRQQFFELSHILPGFSEVEGAEVFVESIVDKILVEGKCYVVDIEVERFGDIFGRFVIGYPEQAT